VINIADLAAWGIQRGTGRQPSSPAPFIILIANPATVNAEGWNKTGGYGWVAGRYPYLAMAGTSVTEIFTGIERDDKPIKTTVRSETS